MRDALYYSGRNRLEHPEHRKVNFIALCCLLTMIFPGTLQAENLNLDIQVVWTNGVNAEREPINSYKGYASGKPLCLWMKITGGEEAMKVLRLQETLPIRHKWYRVIGGRIYHDLNQEPEQWLHIDDITLFVGNAEKNEKLEEELKATGMFDWRTWSCKNNITPGKWRVRVVFNNNELACDTCQFDIRF